VGILLDLLDNIRDLVYFSAVGSWPGSPLVAVNRTEIPLFIRPFVPDCYSVILQVFDIGVSRQKPKQFVHYGSHMQLLGRQCGKSSRQIETHLMPENANRPGSGSIIFFDTGCQNSVKET